MKVCQQCGVPFELASTGHPPKFCLSTCRKNAWHAEKTRQAVAEAVQAERCRVADALGLGPAGGVS
jgi:hypothetical protein